MLNPLPEYIKVRSYLFTFAMKNRGQECQIPSENELSAMFGVSRVTVRGAIKGLLKDRLLFTRRGMGTFVNPEYLKSGRFLAAGLLVGNGGHATDQFSPSLFSACQMCGIHPEILFVPDSNTPGRLAEQCRSLDAVLWQFFESPPTDYIQALREAGIPVLGLSSANHAAAGCDHLAISPETCGDILSEISRSNGHSKLLFIVSDLTVEHHFRPGATYHQWYCRAHHLPLATEHVNPDNLIRITQLPELAADPDFRERFSMIYSSRMLVPEITEILKKNGIQVPEDLSFVVNGESSPVFFDGQQPSSISYRNTLEQLAVEWLVKRVLHKDPAGNFERVIPFEFTPGKTIRKQTV